MLTPESLKAACVLVHNSPQTKPLLEHLQQERERCRELLESSLHPLDSIRALQGEAQAYKKILETIERLSK